MKIGGFDISMSANIIHQDVDVLLRLARIAWPNGVIDIEDYSVPLATAPKMRWPIPCELFIYKSSKAQEIANEEGITPRCKKDIICVYIHRDGIDFVVCAKNSATASLVKDIITAIKENQRLQGEKLHHDK